MLGVPVVRLGPSLELTVREALGPPVEMVAMAPLLVGQVRVPDKIGS